jgi:Domain of unknown function DUF29
MADVVELANSSALYEADEHAWIEQQVAALRDGDLDRLDRANLIAFLTAMAMRDVRELKSRLVVLYAHVLKFRIQPETATRSWRLTVLEQQRAIRTMLESLPSLKRRADDILREVYSDAVRAASIDTGVTSKSIPSQPMLDIAGVLDFDATAFPDG